MFREVAAEATFSDAGSERFAADARAIAATLRPYARRHEALLRPMMEAAALLTAGRDVAADLAAAVEAAAACAGRRAGRGAGGDALGDDAAGGGDNAFAKTSAAAAAELARLRDITGVHRLSNAQISKVISCRKSCKK
jgi:hypothetical protein